MADDTDDLELPEGKRSRVVDYSTRDARHAVADVVQRLGPLRSRLALIYARTQRSLSETERAAMEAECQEMTITLHEARVGLLDNLIEAPRKVAGHSRVTDAERAIDNLDDALAKCLELLRR